MAVSANSCMLCGFDENRETGRSDDQPSGSEGFLVESLAWGLLQVCGVNAPPVPVREMICDSLPIFNHLTLLELNIGLYDATYKLLLDGSQLIAVDLGKPRNVQRASMARELYVAFCRSSRAAELDWPHREKPYAWSDFFARCLLMPAAWVREACADPISLESLVARFDVPIPLLMSRLSELGYYVSGSTVASLVYADREHPSRDPASRG